LHKLHKRTIVLLYGCWLTVVCGAWAGAGLWASQHHSGSSLTRSDTRARGYLRFVQFVQSRRTPDCTNCTNARLCSHMVVGSLWCAGLGQGQGCGYHSIILAAVSLVLTPGHADTCDLCHLCNRITRRPVSGVFSQSESLPSVACAQSASCPGALAHAASSLTVRAWTMTTRTQHKCQEA
jgi:hypothetical protein